MKTLLTLAAFFLINTALFSQGEYVPTDSTKIVTMNNGDIRVGEIISDDGREILLLTHDLGKIYISKQNIKSIKPYDSKVVGYEDGELYVNSPFTTRYYFTTNALPLKKGENYAMIHLYGPEIHFSLNKRLSLGIMTTWIASPFVFAAKYAIPTKNAKVNFGLGTLIGTSGYLNSFRGYGGLHWGMLTLGNETKNITFSAGYSYIMPGSYNNKSVGTAPVLSVAGITKIGKKASFIFDSMFFFGSKDEKVDDYIYDPVTGNYSVITSIQNVNSTIGFLMPGVRFQSSPKTAFQVALAGVLYAKNNNQPITFPVPQCSWFFKF